ncbi:MAG: NAD-dependent protein deacetylase [Myxococcaceae bacterium]|nr:NAD-dependent protein deacetylase [Myxococcaceae bacterium]
MSAAELDALTNRLRGRRVLVLTGAGVSTDSGIPDYRGRSAPARRRPPIQHQDFVREALVRARYWARSTLGWPRLRDVAPNVTHRALAAWQRSGQLAGLITQNVDQLHQKGGAVDVIELHGALADVRCLACGGLERREALQERLVRDNPGLVAWSATVLPDGDVELPDEAVARFVVPSCRSCGGVLKPDVVFFGDSVPQPRVQAAFSRLERAEVLLVLGSSLTVFSGYRFALRAHEQGQPIVIVNDGPTRADALATLRAGALVADVIPQLVERLTAP